MGIKGLSSFLIKNFPRAFNHHHLSHFSQKKVAVDAMIYLYKAKTNKYGFYYGWIHFLILLRKYNIHPYIIYDSLLTPEGKNETIKMRREKVQSKNRFIEYIKSLFDNYKMTGKLTTELKNAALAQCRYDIVTDGQFNADNMQAYISYQERMNKTVTREDIEISKEINKIFGIPYTIAHDESDKLCAALYHNNKVAVVISDDSDLLAYGCNVIQNINIFNETVLFCNFNILLEDMSMNYLEFLDFCILCGTDYNNVIESKNDNKYIFLNLKYHKNIENFRPIFNLDFIRGIYKNIDYEDLIIPYCDVPDFGEVSRILNKYEIYNVSLGDVFTSPITPVGGFAS